MKPKAEMPSEKASHAAVRRAVQTGEHLQIANLSRNTILADKLEVASTGPARSKGLLGRAGLAAGEGLWIIPCESVHTFWMQFPIDLVYIDKKHRVKKVRSNVPPWRVSACLSAHSVIELPAGVACESRTLPGDQLEFSLASEETVSTPF